MSIQSTTNSRFNILSWINDTLLLPLTKIEQLGSGSVYCQLIDAAYPQRISLNKVKWDAKLQIQFLHNFKILVTSFQYLGIDKKIDIQKLSKARYQDNLQFIQWLKSYVEDKIDYAAYQPLKRRNYAKIYLGFLDKKKFNVTLNQTSNKQNSNLDASTTIMKSSIRSNVSTSSNMKSSVLTTRGSMSNLMNISVHNAGGNSKNLKTQPDDEQKGKQKTKQIDKSGKDQVNAKVYEKRKNIGPISVISSLNRKPLAKNQSAATILQAHQKSIVKNVQVIQSEGSEDEFF